MLYDPPRNCMYSFVNTESTVGFALLGMILIQPLSKHTVKVDEEDANKKQILYLNPAINKHC